MDVTYDTAVVAVSYREALDRATAHAEAFYGNAPFHLDRVRAERVVPNATFLPGPPPGPVHEVDFRFVGDPLQHAPTVDGEPEPMSPEGDCPVTGEPCRELCGLICLGPDA